MRLLSAFLVVLSLSCLCRADSMSKQILPEDPLAGARIFSEKQCSYCHSIRRNDLTSRLGPNLASIHLKGSLLDVAGILWNHAPNMIQKMTQARITTPKFTGKEMANLIAFLTAYQYYLQQAGRAPDPSAGEVIWGNRCSVCHSFAENWNKPGPSLRYYKNVSPVQMAQAMWNHGPEMAKTMAAKGVPVPQFSGDEMLDLIAYIRSQLPSTSDQIYVQPGNPNQGAALFEEKRCTACHPISGKGGDKAPDLGEKKELLQDVSHVAGLMWNHSSKMWNEMQRKGIPIPKFTGGEMADIIAYLYLINYYDRPGNPVRGASLFKERNCGNCHHLSGPPGVGPNLTLVKDLDSPTEVIAEMWNHIPQMSVKMKEHGLMWQRLYPGDMNDLIAYLLQKRETGAATNSKE